MEINDAENDRFSEEVKNGENRWYEVDESVRTYDDLEVPDTHELKYFPVCWGGFSFEHPLYLLEKEFNYDGSPKPYWILYFMGIKLTGGWLFDERAASPKETKA